ncbi:hypothetical protein Q5752_003459 [Cryptotrichosporon argae]
MSDDEKPHVDSEDEVKLSKKKRAAPVAGGSQKKARPSEASAAAAPEVEETADGDKYIKLSAYRRVTVRQFKGKTLVDLREYYEDKVTGEDRPGSKGLSLTVEQWTALKQAAGTVDELVARLA